MGQPLWASISSPVKSWGLREIKHNDTVSTQSHDLSLQRRERARKDGFLTPPTQGSTFPRVLSCTSADFPKIP